MEGRRRTRCEGSVTARSATTSGSTNGALPHAITDAAVAPGGNLANIGRFPVRRLRGGDRGRLCYVLFARRLRCVLRIPPRARSEVSGNVALAKVDYSLLSAGRTLRVTGHRDQTGVHHVAAIRRLRRAGKNYQSDAQLIKSDGPFGGDLCRRRPRPPTMRGGFCRRSGFGHQEPLLFSPSMANQRRVPAVRRSRQTLPETRGVAGSDTLVDVTCQLAGLRAMTIHAAPLIITDRSPGRLAKAARTAAEARARMSSG